MAKTLDITDKLDFDGNPKLVIKGEEIEVNADAPTVLKVMGIMNDNPGLGEVLKAYELIFPEESRKKLDGLKMKFNGLITVLHAAIELITDDSGEEGNEDAHTTT